MKCPFELPVEAHISSVDSDMRYITGSNGFPFICGDINTEYADYIVQAINSHEKLVKALKENYEYTKYAGANKRINTQEYMDEFFNRGLSAQQVVKQVLKEVEQE